MACSALAFLQHLLSFDSQGWLSKSRSSLDAFVASVGGAWAPLSARLRDAKEVAEASAKDIGLPAVVGGGRRGLSVYGETYLLPITSALV